MATLREIAEELGCTKQTVTARLKELDMWETHVSKSGRIYEVDAEAASAVADSLKDHARPAERALDGYADVAIGALQAAIDMASDQNAALARELEAKNEQISNLQYQLAQAQETIMRLSRRSWLDRMFGRSLPPAQ